MFSRLQNETKKALTCATASKIEFGYNRLELLLPTEFAMINRMVNAKPILNPRGSKQIAIGI